MESWSEPEDVSSDESSNAGYARQKQLRNIDMNLQDLHIQAGDFEWFINKTEWKIVSAKRVEKKCFFELCQLRAELFGLETQNEEDVSIEFWSRRHPIRRAHKQRAKDMDEVEWEIYDLEKKLERSESTNWDRKLQLDGMKMDLAMMERQIVYYERARKIVAIEQRVQDRRQQRHQYLRSGASWARKPWRAPEQAEYHDMDEDSSVADGAEEPAPLLAPDECSHNVWWDYVKGSVDCSNCDRQQLTHGYQCPTCWTPACACCRDLLRGWTA